MSNSKSKHSLILFEIMPWTWRSLSSWTSRLTFPVESFCNLRLIFKFNDPWITVDLASRKQSWPNTSVWFPILHELLNTPKLSLYASFSEMAYFITFLLTYNDRWSLSRFKFSSVSILVSRVSITYLLISCGKSFSRRSNKKC